MKRLIVSIITLAISFVAFAQTSHFTFKGVPIDGSITKFVSALEGTGYELLYQTSDGDGAMLSGTFTNQDVTIFVLTTPKTHTVWKVAVFFEDQSNWYSLKDDYLNLKASLTMKYGAPDPAYEFFISPYEEGDGYEMTAIYAEKCYYTSFFQVKSATGADLGAIVLEISKNETKARIALAYEDAANTDLMKREKETIVYDDL